MASLLSPPGQLKTPSQPVCIKLGSRPLWLPISLGAHHPSIQQRAHSSLGSLYPNLHAATLTAVPSRYFSDKFTTLHLCRQPCFPGINPCHCLLICPLKQQSGPDSNAAPRSSRPNQMSLPRTYFLWVLTDLNTTWEIGQTLVPTII